MNPTDRTRLGSFDHASGDCLERNGLEETSKLRPLPESWAVSHSRVYDYDITEGNPCSL